MIAKLHVKYAEPGLELVTLDGFNAFLLSSDNAPIRDDSQQDMSRPLCEYYISSSHNVSQSSPSIVAAADVSTDLPRRKPDSRTKYGRRIYSSSSARLSMCRTYVDCPVCFAPADEDYSRRLVWRRRHADNHSRKDVHLSTPRSRRTSSYRKVRLPRFAVPRHPQSRNPLRFGSARKSRSSSPRHARRQADQGTTVARGRRRRRSGSTAESGGITRKDFAQGDCVVSRKGENLTRCVGQESRGIDYECRGRTESTQSCAGRSLDECERIIDEFRF